MIYIFNDTADKAARDAAAQNEAEKQELTKLRDEAVVNAKAVSFKNKHFKFLGRHIHYNTSKSDQRKNSMTSPKMSRR